MSGIGERVEEFIQSEQGTVKEIVASLADATEEEIINLWEDVRELCEDEEIEYPQDSRNPQHNTKALFAAASSLPGDNESIEDEKNRNQRRQNLRKAILENEKIHSILKDSMVKHVSEYIKRNKKNEKNLANLVGEIVFFMSSMSRQEATRFHAELWDTVRESCPVDLVEQESFSKWQAVIMAEVNEALKDAFSLEDIKKESKKTVKKVSQEKSYLLETLKDISNMQVILPDGSINDSFKEFYQSLDIKGKAEWLQKVSRAFTGITYLSGNYISSAEQMFSQYSDENYEKLKNVLGKNSPHNTYKTITYTNEIIFKTSDFLLKKGEEDLEALLIRPKYSGTFVEKSEAEDTAYVAEFEQYPELCLFLAEALSEITEEAANQAINCYAEENHRKLTYRDIYQYSYSLSQAREASFLLFFELINNSSLFKKCCQEVAIKQRAQKEEETYNSLRQQTLGWIRTLGFCFSMNPVKWVAGFVNGFINSAYSISRTPKSLLQEVISKPKNGHSFIDEPIKRTAKQEGRKMFRKKREVMEQLKWRIHMLSLSEFGESKEAVANKKAMLKELKDRIKSVEVVTPAEILSVIKKWKQENNSTNTTTTEPNSSATKNTETLPDSITKIRKGFFGESFGKVKHSASKKLITNIEKSLEKRLTRTSKP